MFEKKLSDFMKILKHLLIGKSSAHLTLSSMCKITVPLSIVQSTPLKCVSHTVKN